MKCYDIAKPIGLATPCAEIETACNEAHMYKRCGLRPSHLVVPLDSGAGRTTFVEYMTDMYKEAGVLDFTSGLDDYIEITFDGTLAQLKQAFASIDAAAVYTNEYSSIVSMDISNLASHLGETQFAEFLKNCKRVCESACVVFFIHTMPSRNEERLLEKLLETVDNIKRLNVEPYTKDDMCALVEKIVIEHGIEIEHEKIFRAVLSDVITEFCISTVKDAVATADSIVRFADFKGFTPSVDESSLEAMITSWHNDAERGEVK